MFKKKLPALIGLLLIVVAAAVGVVFIGDTTDFLPRAAPEYLPREVRITNVTNTGFSISWVTQEPSIGFIKIGETEKNLNNTVVDDRDQLTGSSNQFRSHYITVQGLAADTAYYFKLGSHDQKLYDNDGEGYSITTAPALSAPPPSDTAYGTVLTPADTPAENAIVYVNLPGATPLSSLVKQNGSWAVSLSQARTQDLSSYIEYDPESTQISILVVDGVNQETLVTTTTGNDQPVPNITIGQDQDLGSQADSGANNSPDQSNLRSKFTFQDLIVTDSDEVETIAVDTFPQDGVITDEARPQISGSAPENARLTITVHSSQIITASVAADEAGQWVWTPPQDLEPGQHSITISYTDQQGRLHTIERQFVVASATAENVDLPNYTATPSATLTPTIQPTSQPTATPAPNVPTTAPSPTLVPSPTAIVRSTIPSTASGTPTAGGIAPTMGIFSLGLGALVIGVILQLKNQRYA